MRKIKHLERIQLLHERIKAENTGTPGEMAKYMNISKRSVHQLIAEIRDLGAVVRYCRMRKTYRYCEDFDIQIQVSFKIIQKDEERNLYGGSYFLKKIPSLQGFCSERDYPYKGPS